MEDKVTKNIETLTVPQTTTTTLLTDDSAEAAPFSWGSVLPEGDPLAGLFEVPQIGQRPPQKGRSSDKPRA
jgi:hypothetical protein